MAISAQQLENQQVVDNSLQIVVPIYNEGENARILYRALVQALDGSSVSFSKLRFVYDIDNDTTLPVIADIAKTDPRVVADKNLFGRGVVNALRWGFSQSTDGPVLVMMGDNSDKLSIIPEMVETWQKGATIVSPSRYMKGGRQHGGGLVKSSMSRVAGVSLRILGFPTSDPTNNFKLYDGQWLSKQKIESVGGFEIALELCAKAFKQNREIKQLPTEWFDRTAGESNFRLWKWLPHYLKWYFQALGSIISKKITTK